MTLFYRRRQTGNEAGNANAAAGMYAFVLDGEAPLNYVLLKP